MLARRVFLSMEIVIEEGHGQLLLAERSLDVVDNLLPRFQFTFLDLSLGLLHVLSEWQGLDVSQDQHLLELLLEFVLKRG